MNFEKQSAAPLRATRETGNKLLNLVSSSSWCYEGEKRLKSNNFLMVLQLKHVVYILNQLGCFIILTAKCTFCC